MRVIAVNQPALASVPVAPARLATRQLARTAASCPGSRQASQPPSSVVYSARAPSNVVAALIRYDGCASASDAPRNATAEIPNSAPDAMP